MATSPAQRREIRLTVPDARLRQVRERIADSVARLDPAAEVEVLRWIETVSDFDG